MSLIQDLAEQLQPLIDAAREDLTVLPNYQVMKGVTDRIVTDHGYDRSDAAHFAMVMKINVQDESDVQHAIDFLMQAFDLMMLTVGGLTSGAVPSSIALEACRLISVEG